jgi:nucleotidyltransferase/DNA polymerase involved in DNA repair
MARMPHLTSDAAACCWIPLFALRCELARRPELASLPFPVALIAPDNTRTPRVWQVAPLARRAGVRPGMTVSQAIGLCPALKLCEPDPVHYDEQFARLVAALVTVSPVVEPVELGRVFVGTDGLEGLYGAPEKIVEVIQMRSAECGMRNFSEGSFASPNSHLHSALHIPHSAFRVGWGRGKFVSWVAATCARPGSAVIVPPGEETKFLASQPLGVLPLDSDTHRRLLQLGVKTLGALTALPEEAVVSQFGRSGRRLWRLAAGLMAEPVVGRVVPEPIVAALTFFTPVGERDLLAHALDKLVDRALGDPRRSGWRVQVVRVSAELEHGASWLVEATLKDPSATRERIVAPLKTQLERSPPAGAVERLVVEFTAFVPGTAELQLFARDATALARAGRRHALQSAAREIALRIRRPMLYHVIEVQPWSRLPERRYALIDYEP